MPAFSFQQQFVAKVESGAKTHTIRARRKNRPRVGQVAYLYYAMRTRQCRKLGEGSITRVQEILLEASPFTITIDGEVLSPDEVEQLAQRDGFESAAIMAQFWNGLYPFTGDIIHWKKEPKV